MPDEIGASLIMEIAIPLATLRSRRHIRLTDRVLQGRWAYYLAGLIGLVMHLLLARPIYLWYDRLLAWIPLIILLFLLRRYIRQSYKSMPALVLVAAQIYLFYSVPQFTHEYLELYGGYYAPSDGALSTAMVLVVFGELLFILGYHIAASAGRNFTTSLYRMIPNPNLNWGTVVSLFSLLGFTVYALTALRPNFIPTSIRNIAGQLFNVYLGLALLLYMGRVFSQKRLLIAAYMLAAGMACVGFIQGMLGAVVGPLLIVFLTRWVWGKGFKFRSIVFIAILVLIINPVKGEFRNLAWGNNDISSFEQVEKRLTDWFTAFAKVWGESSMNEALQETTTRTNDLLSFAQVIDLVPSSVPYNSGEGLMDLLVQWVPRIILPSKGVSTDLIYNRYAIVFGYSSVEMTRSTTVNISTFTEGYWNFGIWGVAIFLFVSGVLLGLLFGNNGRSEDISVLICLVYIAPSIFILQALTVTVASLFSFLIGIVSALWGLSAVSRLLRLKVAE